MKKIFSIMLAVVMMAAALVCFASCGDHEGKDKVKVIDIKLTDEEYAFIFDKGNTTLKDDFNAYLAEIKSNGTYQAIVDKYFGSGEKVGVDVANGTIENKNDNFVVVTNCPFEPFEYIGDDGKIYGIDIEIAKGYAEKKGLTLVVKNLPEFDSIFTEVDEGYADIGMAGITVSPDRQELYEFSDTYYNASQKIVVAADNTDFDNCKTKEDVENVIKGLSGKTIGYQTGTTGNWYVAGDADWGYDGFSNVTPKGYSTALDAMNDMVNGNIYAVVVDEAPGAAMVNSINK